MTTIPFDKREGVIWIDGNFTEWNNANIHLLTHGLHYASAVFEGVRVYDYKPFKLREHQERLINSANLLGYKIPYSLEELEKASLEIINKQNIKNGYLRPIAWLGSESMLISGKECKVHTAIAGWESFEQTRKSVREKGALVKISNWKKSPLGCIPFKSKASGIYTILTMVKNDATNTGYDDAIMLDIYGNMTEGTTSNFFVIYSNKLITPIPDCFLNGITRQTIINIANKLGIKTLETYIKPDELEKAEAAFFTGTAIEIMPIRRIDYNDKNYNYDINHPILGNLIKSYQELVKSN